MKLREKVKHLSCSPQLLFFTFSLNFIPILWNASVWEKVVELLLRSQKQH